MGSRQDGKVTYRTRHSHPASRYIGTLPLTCIVVALIVDVIDDGDGDDEVDDDGDGDDDDDDDDDDD